MKTTHTRDHRARAGSSRSLERRLDVVDQKLDYIIEALPGPYDGGVREYASRHYCARCTENYIDDDV